MKLNINKYIPIIGTVAVLGLACSDPEYPKPEPTSESSDLAANFIFVDASPDAPDVDLFVNNAMTTANAAGGYTTVPITANGVFQNTSLRAKASSGTIGGILGSNDLVFRAANNSSNNFQAANGGRYTIIVADSIGRPKPLRTLNASNFGDTTYFNLLTGQYVSVVERASMTTAQKAKLVAIGTVPLGSTDPGGLRFYVTNDIFPTFAAGNTTQAGIRVINASPNTTSLSVRLKPAAGSNVSLGNNLAYVMSFPTQSPAVGSRNVTVTTSNFPLQTIALAGTPIVYTLEVATSSAFTNIVFSIPNVTFDVGGIYTIVLEGSLSMGNVTAEIIKHN
jgi:hypothetical protein